MVLVKKLKFFHLLCFLNIDRENIIPMVKKLKFFHVLCLSKIDREKVFADVLDKKAAFNDFKNNCL